eukprot:3771274-Alexandrium_andersonii.AAC.1
MSASLVGSEMCIRDRSWGAANSASGLVLFKRSRRELGTAWEAAQRGLPVSYTHLTLPTICSV